MSQPRALLRLAAQPAPPPAGGIVSGRLQAVETDGALRVECPDGLVRTCAWLENNGTVGVQLAPGDMVLVLIGEDGKTPHVVMGRVGPYGSSRNAHLRVEAAQSMTLACGESSIDLRADGKVVIRGDDVLVHAKGSQRIRAGTVSIN